MNNSVCHPCRKKIWPTTEYKNFACHTFDAMQIMQVLVSIQFVIMQIVLAQASETVKNIESGKLRNLTKPRITSCNHVVQTQDTYIHLNAHDR